MNKYLIAIVMMALGAAGYSQKSEAAACASAQYSTYLAAGFSCDIGDKTFSNFTEGFSGFPARPDFSVAPVLGPPLWGFNFSGIGLAAGPGVVMDITIGYTVTCIAVGACITSNHLDFNGISSGTGLASVTDNICLGSSVPGCASPLQLVARALNNGGPLAANSTNAAVHMENVSKDMSAAGGNGSATISVVNNTVDQSVPEPATLALLGASLFSMAAIRRRKTRT